MKKMIAPKTRNMLARSAYERNGAGFHEKSCKAKTRQARRLAKQRGWED